MSRHFFFLLATIAMVGCQVPPQLLGGYTVSYGDRGKAWLQNPDGTIAYAGLIKTLHIDERNTLLVAYPESDGGVALSPYPTDDTCYVVLVIDGPKRRIRQIHMAEADRLSARMSEVESYNRPCLKGMPNTPT